MLNKCVRNDCTYQGRKDGWKGGRKERRDGKIKEWNKIILNHGTIDFVLLFVC